MNTEPHGDTSDIENLCEHEETSSSETLVESMENAEKFSQRLKKSLEVYTKNANFHSLLDTTNAGHNETSGIVQYILERCRDNGELYAEVLKCCEFICCHLDETAKSLSISRCHETGGAEEMPEMRIRGARPTNGT